MNWVRFATAVYEAQSQLGISLAKAHEELSAAVENDKVTSRHDDEGDCWVFDTSLLNWIKAKQRRPGGKQPKLAKLLAKMFPNGPVPDDYVRKVLKAELLKIDAGLAPLDEDTLKTAIDKHNSTHR